MAKLPEVTAALTAITFVDLVFLFGLSWVNQETNKIIIASCHKKSQSKTTLSTAIIAFLVPQQGWGLGRKQTTFRRINHKKPPQSFLKTSCGMGQYLPRGKRR